MLAHADGVSAPTKPEEVGAKLQEVAQTASVLAHVDGLLENEPTGPPFSRESAVLGHAEFGNDVAKAQEGASSFDAGGAHKKLV